jgi:hypothetical protein
MMHWSKAASGAGICLLLLLAGPDKASASGIVSDFNSDGFPDTATVIREPRPQIRVALSGSSQIIVLHINEQPLSLVAADVDRDGRIDLAGTFRSRGIVVFRNNGSAHFRRWGKRIHLHLRDRLNSWPARTDRDNSERSAMARALVRDDPPVRWGLRASIVVEPRPPTSVLFDQTLVLLSRHFASPTPRAPPAAAFFI